MSTIAIVGAGPQLGRAIGRRFAREGYDVALIARSRPRLEELAAELGGSGVRAAAFPADVTDREGLRAALAGAEEHFGTIDVLEFSPGPTPSDFAVRPAVEAAELTVEAVVPEIEMTVYGGITAIGQVLPGMLARGSGTILVSAGSGAGPMNVPGVANYNVATAGLRNLVLGLHASVAARGVYAAHVSLAAFIGQGRPNSEPDVIADAYWRLHTERTQAELFYDDLPEGFTFEAVSPQFTNENA